MTALARPCRLGAWLAPILLLASGGARGESDEFAVGEPASGEALQRHVVLKTSLGRIRLALAPEVSAAYCRRFLELCRGGVYDGTLFNRVERGAWLEAGQFNTRGKPVTAAQKGLLKPLPREPRAVRMFSNGSVSFLRPDIGDSLLRFYLGSAAYPDESAIPFAQVVGGYETLARINGVRIGENGYPLRAIAIFETTVLRPEAAMPPDPIYDQLVEERYRNFVDPKYELRPERVVFRQTPPTDAARGEDPAVALAALLGLLGLALCVWGGRRAPQLPALGALGFLTGGFALYVLLFEDAQESGGLAGALFVGAIAACWMLGRVESPEAEAPQAGPDSPTLKT
ncbi:MAG: peptidylprolyl isomerase [Planctomycetota bacterium]|nr:peptidylprolyl isomerase [Planctomycetota bacterium]